MTTPILSASQVSTFGTEKEGGNNAGCERKWAFKYVAKLPDPSGPSAEAGKLIHSYIEGWLRDSLFPEGATLAAKTARAMIKYLPEPSPELRVEEPFGFELDGVPWRGFMDLLYYDGATLVVHDHKTTSDLKWAKTEEELRHDAQSILYAYKAFGESDVVDLSWLYGTRDKTPQVLPVRFNISFDEVLAAMPPLTRTGKRILALYEKQPDPNSLDPNLAMCDAYGGCPFKAACSITPKDRVKALQTQHKRSEDKQMGFRDRIRNSNGTTTVEQTVEVSEVAPTVVAKPTMREKLQGFGSAINPPGQTIIDAGEERVETYKTGITDVPPKRKPGRPKKVYTEQQGADLIHGAVDRTPGMGAVFTPKAEWVAAAVEPDATGFTLYVNCMPQGPSTTLAKYLEPILAAINLEHGVEHYAMIDFKAAGILGAALYTALQSNPPTGALVMDARTGEGAHSLPTLERFASTVVRGF